MHESPSVLPQLTAEPATQLVPWQLSLAVQPLSSALQLVPLEAALQVLAELALSQT